MNPRQESSTVTIGRWIVRVAMLALLLYFVWRVQQVIFLVLMAAVLAAALEPLVAFICRYRVRAVHPRTQRLMVTTIVFIAIGVGLVASITWMAAPFGQEFRRLGSYSTAVKTFVEEFQKDAQKAVAGFPPFIRDLIPKQDTSAIGERLYVFTTAFLTRATEWISHIWELLIIPVLAFYFVLDSLPLKKLAISFVPPRHRSEAMRIVHDGSLVFRNYIVGQIILCVIAGVFMGFLLTYLKVKYALTLSVLAGVTRAVPIVGPIVSGIAILLVIAAADVVLAVKVLVVFSILHFVESKFLMPVLIGDRMRLHPALLLVSILIAYEFFGILGMFLAAPVAALARTLIKTYYIDRRDAGHGSGGSPAPIGFAETGEEQAVAGASSTAVA